ncbi:MAG: FGGY-family carbohydrate kinase [Actinomycetota bacterium]
MTVLLGVDVGTTATKAVLLDPGGGIVGEAERPVRLYSPHPGWAEEDTEEWWGNVRELTRELAAPRKIAAVGFSGMVPCVILLDEAGQVLRRSIQQNDARAIEQIRKLRERLAEARVLERTGSPITQQSVGPTLMWLAEHESEAWGRARAVVGSYDLMAFRMTGERTVEANWALESGLYDLHDDRWARDIVEAAGADAALLPPVRRAHEVVGHVTDEAAAETGIPTGTPVVAGSADHVASAFAAGIVDEGDLLVKLGGAGDILLATGTPLVDPRLYLDFHLVPGRYMPNGCMAASGSLILWFQRNIAAGASLEELDREAEAAGPGAGGVVALPYFLGEKTPINDPEARGAFVGLHLGHDRGHLFRAVLEAIAFGFRHHVDVFTERGHPPRRVRVTNGGARSWVWTQVTADVLGMPLEKLASRGGSAVGAAFAAGMGIGAFSDWREIDRFLEVADVVEPRGDDAYERAYRSYRALYPAMREVMT